MTRKRAPDVREAQLIRAAVAEFVKRGFDAATMDGIARRARLSKGALYHHFDNKDAVFLAAVRSFVEPVDGFIHESSEMTGAAEAIRSFIGKYVRHWTERQTELTFQVLSIAKSLTSKDLWKEQAEYSRAMIDFFDSLYARGIAAGEFRLFDTRARATALVAALDGVLAYSVMDPDLAPVESIRRLENVFVDDLLKP